MYDKKVTKAKEINLNRFSNMRSNIITRVVFFVGMITV